MAIAVIPALLRKLTGGRDRITVSGKNLRDVIAQLEREFPGLAEQLIEEGELKPSVAVSIDGEVKPGGLLERIGEHSEIHFIPAIGGGA